MIILLIYILNKNKDVSIKYVNVLVVQWLVPFLVGKVIELKQLQEIILVLNLLHFASFLLKTNNFGNK